MRVRLERKAWKLPPVKTCMIKATEAEKKNGWSDESLQKYVADREKAQLKNASKVQEPQRPEVQNSKYDVHKLWR